MLAPVERVVRELARGVNTRDASICTRLFTLHRVEAITRRKGDAAVAECRRDIARSSSKITRVRIEGIRVDRTKEGVTIARVQFQSRVRNRKARQLLQLVRVRGRYRIHDALRVRQPR